MGFWERLLKYEDPGIPVHAFQAALGEIERGKMVAAQVAAGFLLTGPEQAEAAVLVDRIVTPLESVALGAFVTLTNIGNAYDTTNASQGLGFARIQTAGITGVEFTVRVNKIGNGTQSWQLWNETDASEITVIDDAGATGAKELAIIRTFPAPLGAGVKLVRVRAKSTTTADDPLYFGAALLIRRVERLTSQELHEILLLGEGRVPPYDSVVAVKARLGV